MQDKFTDQFISLPIRIYTTTGDEDLMDQQERKVRIKIRPMEIESYHFTIAGEEHVVQVNMRSGLSFFVYISIHDFQNLLNQWQTKKSSRYFHRMNQFWNVMRKPWGAAWRTMKKGFSQIRH